MPEIRPSMVMNQVIVTVSCAENGGLTKKLVVWMRPLNLLLTSEFQHLPMRVRVFRGHKCRTRGGSVFGYQPTRFVSYPTCIAQSFRTHRPGPPLRGLLRRAMQAPPAVAGGLGILFLLRRRRFRRLLEGVKVRLG